MLTNSASFSRLIMREPSGPLIGRVVSEHEGEHVSKEVVAVVRTVWWEFFSRICDGDGDC